MGGGTSSELVGPDLAKDGVAFANLEESKPLLGHANGEAVVVVRVGNDVHAIGATCTHYGGPLAEGRVVGKTIRCPWHHACFDLETGRALGAPALGNNSCWAVERAGDLVQVRSKKELTKPKPKHSPSSVVIVGAGAAGAACVEMLRKEGYEGPITMLGSEEPGPVDRPNLSKDYLAGNAPEEWIPLGSLDRYKELKVDLRPSDPATAIDTKSKTVTTKSGEKLSYGALLFATGAEPVRLTIPGATLPHVFTLRTLADSRAIIEAAKSSKMKRAVVIGTSFIGLEAAASLIARGLEVHVVGPDKVPLARVMGDELGTFIQKLHEAKGVKFHLGTTPKEITADAVELANGEKLTADVVVMGVGVRPRITLAEQSGLEIQHGGVAVGVALETNADSVWAAGDVARYSRATRIEHWAFAERSGEHVAREMLRPPSDKPTPFKDVPFFWSAHYDVTIAYVGHIEQLGPIEVKGDLEKRDATIIYRTPSKAIAAVATLNRDNVSLAIEEAMERGSDPESLERIV